MSKHTSHQPRADGRFPVRSDVASIAWLLRQRLKGNRITGPSCRGCGYSVTGLQSTICPECGADLSQVGIVHTQGVKRWPALMAGMVFWTLVIWFMSSLLSMPLQRALFPPIPVPTGLEKRWEPASRAHHFIHLYAKGRPIYGVRSQPPPPVAYIILLFTTIDSPSVSRPALWIDPQTMAMGLRDDIHDWGQPMDALQPVDDPKAFFLDWCSIRGLSVDVDDQRGEMEAIWQLVEFAQGADMAQFQAAVSQPLHPGLRDSVSSFRSAMIEAPPWGMNLVRGLWLLLWLAGIVGLALMKAKRQVG